MREYSKVSPSFWIGTTGRQLQEKGIEAIIVGMYLVTSPHANMIGLYYCPVEYISSDTGLTLQGASKGLRWASEAGFCGYDHATRMVWVYEMAKFQIDESLKSNDKRVFGVRNEYKKLPNNPFLEDFFNKYKDSFHLDERRGSEAPCKPLRSQEQEQEQEQNKKLCAFAEQKTPGCGGGDDEFYLTAKKKKLKGKILEAFNAFWRAFDYPKGKASAADAFLAVYTPENIGEIIAGAAAEAMERPMIIAGGKTPKWAQGWLTGRRWEDLKEDAGQPPTIVLPEYVPPLKGGM
jgi:hypothetical protein